MVAVFSVLAFAASARAASLGGEIRHPEILVEAAGADAAFADDVTPADDIAADYFRRRRYIGAKDRAQIAAHVYAVLRHRAVLDWWIARATPTLPSPASGGGLGRGLSGECASKGGIAPDARTRAIAALLLIDKWTAEDVGASFDGGRFRPAALSAAEQRLVRALAGRTLTHPGDSTSTAMICLSTMRA